MSLLPRICLMLALSGLATGCQTGATAPGGGDVTPNAVAGDAIEVTALDAPPPAAPALPPTGPVAVDPAQPVVSTEAVLQAPEPAAAGPTAASEPAPVDTEAEPPEAAPAVEPPPPPPKSERQIACEKKRGTWTSTPGGLNICVRTTRDGGKRCTRESQCEGVCLARSGTCAPIDPILGCQDILQENGARATECIE